MQVKKCKSIISFLLIIEFLFYWCVSYELMLQCWNANPNDRPDFADIADLVGEMLDDKTKKHYIELNNPYLEMNEQILGTSDYLKMSSNNSNGNGVGCEQSIMVNNEDNAITTITTTMIGSPINDCSGGGGGGGGGSSTTTIQQNQNNCLVTLTANHSHLGSFIDHYPSFNAVFGPINSAATTTANNNSAAAANVSGNSSIVAAGSTIIDGGGGGGGGYNFSIQHPHNPLGTSLSLSCLLV